MMGLCTFSSCGDKLDITNPNQQTSSTFGETADDLEESVIAAYNHIRMEGTYARVGYNIDVCRGDEVWNSSQVWYMPFDDLNEPVTDEIGMWSWMKKGKSRLRTRAPGKGAVLSSGLRLRRPF